MPRDPIRTALVGAGYIAAWHADAIRAVRGTRLAAVVDSAPAAAQALADACGVPAYGSVADLLAAGVADAAHILTPPHLHKALAVECLEGGLDVFVEKPFATSTDEAQAMLDAARAAGRQIGVGHNFLGLPAYARLKRLVAAGDLGRISSAEIAWHLPLAPLRSGPFGLWMLRDRRNLLLELGPHLFAFARDLFGPVEVLSVVAGHDIDLPGGGGTRPQSWRILARAGQVEITFALSTVEVTDDRRVTLRGSSGLARLDYAADVLTVRRENTSDLILNPLRKELSQAGQHLREGVVNAARQLISLNRKGPYALGFQGAIAGFYAGVRSGTPDPRFSGEAALAVIDDIEATLTLLPPDETPAPKKPRGKPKPTAMVIGGTGFIGQHLVRGLVARGEDVLVLSRGSFGPFDDIAGQVETRAVSLRDEDALAQAMDGIGVVYNLAKSMDTTWEAALENDVGTSDRIARACLAAGVDRLVYTGTIASYDMADPKRTITEDTAFADDMADRNLYARSKAECEKHLMRMHRDDGLPVTIARPGIVLGPHGPLQHWGIGRWHGAGAVRLWGSGRNVLPFVLIDDVVDGLIRMGSDPAAVGEDFNLVGAPVWTARDYFNAIHAAFGARIRVSSGPMLPFFLSDALKWTLKRYALGQHDAVRASLADWKSRAHFSAFDNRKPRQMLAWQPVTDQAEFARRAMAAIDLFGF